MCKRVTNSTAQVFMDSKQMTCAREQDSGYYRITKEKNNRNEFSCDLLSGHDDWTGATAHVRSTLWSLVARKTKRFDSGTGTIQLDADTRYSIEKVEPAIPQDFYNFSKALNNRNK